MVEIQKINKKIEKLLMLIAENDYATTNVLIDLFAERTVWLYLHTLQKKNYVMKFSTNMLPKEAYMLTPLGYKFLEAEGKLRVIKKFYVSKYNPSTFFHTIFSLHVRIIFESHPQVLDYRTQKVIMFYKNGSIHGKQFDAEVIVQGSQKKYVVGIEIETSMKSHKRYATQIINIDTHRKDIDFVCWVCSSEAIIRGITEVLQRIRSQLQRPDIHYLMTLDEFKTKKWNTYWYTIDGKKNGEPLPLVKNDLEGVRCH